jgi:hypothetical protein
LPVSEPLKDTEAEAIERAVLDLQFDNVTFAFFHIAPSHPFLVFDHSQPGIGFSSATERWAGGSRSSGAAQQRGSAPPTLLKEHAIVPSVARLVPLANEMALFGLPRNRHAVQASQQAVLIVCRDASACYLRLRFGPSVN